jgi:hypothetical protein
MVRGFEKLTVTEIIPAKEGLIVKATYPGWTFQFTFILQRDGRIKGASGNGWQDITNGATKILAAKVFVCLGKRSRWAS